MAELERRTPVHSGVPAIEGMTAMETVMAAPDYLSPAAEFGPSRGQLARRRARPGRGGPRRGRGEGERGGSRQDAEGPAMTTKVKVTTLPVIEYDPDQWGLPSRLSVPAVRDGPLPIMANRRRIGEVAPDGTVNGRVLTPAQDFSEYCKLSAALRPGGESGGRLRVAIIDGKPTSIIATAGDGRGERIDLTMTCSMAVADRVRGSDPVIGCAEVGSWPGVGTRIVTLGERVGIYGGVAGWGGRKQSHRGSTPVDFRLSGDRLPFLVGGT